MAHRLGMLLLIPLAGGCRREQEAVPTERPTERVAGDRGAVVGTEMPSHFGHLRFEPVSNVSPPAYRVRSDQDPAVDFVVPASVLRSLIGDDRVPIETRAAAVLAYPELEKVVRQMPPPEAAGDESPAPSIPPRVLVSSSQGEVRVEPDAERRGFMRVVTRDRAFRIPSTVALSVLEDAHLSDDHKIQALLTFPALESIPSGSE